MAKIKNTNDSLCWRGCGVRGNTPTLLLGMQTYTNTLAISMVVSQKTEINLPQNPAITLFGIHPKDAQSYYKSICSTMFIAALFIMYRMWKQPRCPSTEDLTRKCGTFTC